MIHAYGKSKLEDPASLSSEERSIPTFVALDAGNDQLRKLTEISRALTYTTSLDQVTRLTVERGTDLLAAQAGVLMLPDADGPLQVRATHGIADDALARLSAPIGDELIGHLHNLFDVPYDRFLAVPLIVHGAVTGVLAVATRQPFTIIDEWLLSAVADQAAVALENARLGGEVRIAMESRLRASEGATAAKDRALSTLAHDIRTPLAAIEAFCGLLEAEVHGAINDRQRETIGRVRMSGRHLLSLLDNVMDMARLNAGAVRLNTQQVRLADVTLDAVQMLTPAADAKLQTLQLGQLSSGVILADASRLRQVLVNIIGNAVKFTPPDGCVSITATERSMNGELWVEIRVTDTGPGIPVAEQQAIFEPYYRSEATAQIPGVGLGLAISHALVQQMGGELDLESEVGIGSSFAIRFPLITT